MQKIKIISRKDRTAAVSQPHTSGAIEPPIHGLTKLGFEITYQNGIWRMKAIKKKDR